MYIPRIVLSTIILLASFGSLAPLHAADGEPISLFDGKTLEGWEFNPNLWRVEGGAITGGSTTTKMSHNDFISTKKSFQNFELRMKIKCSGDPKTGLINSGIQIRSMRIPGGGHVSGYQVDCGEGWFGVIYDESRRNKPIAQPIDPAALAKAVDAFGWNEYRILAEGPRIRVWINGLAATDYTETNPNIALDGHIAPQVHGGGACLVQFKDITIRELPSTPNAPTWESLGGVVAAQKKATLPPARKAPKGTSHNDVKGTPRSAAQQRELFHLPEGYEIELVAQESPGIGKFISVYFDQRGRLWTQTALEYPVDGNENPGAAQALYQSKARDRILVYPREALSAPLPPEGLTNPTIFADGLAIPLGILPWSNGDSCYALHGPDLLLLTDSNGDGVSDQRKVILTGFGIQDSHLFPHQFTRAPDGSIWMAQGLFNNSNVTQPGGTEAVPFPKCSMARMQPDGSGFEVTSVGPNNIWGLIITGEGDAFIQEANDYGYPIMPFHDYAYYPGGMAGHRKSFQPEFPPTASFRMGGTGLSGLALLEDGPSVDKDADLTVLIANPITSKVQTLSLSRDRAGWKLDQKPDFITCDDPLFRPVGMTQGPDGFLYIVDWYNKIISHNEVPRNHPDRDKTRGRIWRVKPSQSTAPAGLPDFTKLPAGELIAMLGTKPTARAHLAWQTLIDHRNDSIISSLTSELASPESSDARKIQAFWALPPSVQSTAKPLAKSTNRNVRRELARHPSLVHEFTDDRDREVRFAVIQTLARQLPESAATVLPQLLSAVQPSLDAPLGKSARHNDPIPVDDGYDREFERFLVRFLLERHPDTVASFLDSKAAANLPLEGRVLAALALKPDVSAPRIAALLPQLDRAPNAEELLRLAQFPEAPGCGEALRALLANPVSRHVVATRLIEQKTSLNAAKITPLLQAPALAMLESDDAQLAVQLIGAFQLTKLEPDLVAMIREPGRRVDVLTLLRALREIQSTAIEVFATLASNSDAPLVRNEALAALGNSRAPGAPAKLLELYPDLDLNQRRQTLSALSNSKSGAKALVAALQTNTIPKEDLDGPTAERLSLILGDDPALTTLMGSLGHVFHDVLRLDGTPNAWAQSNINLTGPFTIETWVNLAPDISNSDGILGARDVMDLNFYNSTFRVWIGGGLHDVAVSTKPITPGLWTHIAVTRDANHQLRIYLNGELDAVGTKPVARDLPGLQIGWTGAAQGTQGDFAEFRVWHRVRTAQEIRNTFDRSFADDSPPKDLGYYSARGGAAWGELRPGARLAKTTDAPPLLTTQQAAELDAKFEKYLKLGTVAGNVENGRTLSALCLACHVVNGQGGQIGPELSGAGAMGLEGVLRNILTPNAAMEAGYRIFRVELKSGDLIDAFFVSDDKDAIVVRQPGGSDQRIERKDILNTSYIRRSLMPEGLLDGLNDEQVSDLLSYLMTLK
jgi:putative membrane-bound dehydrogenase-like protein